ncbi:MAG: ACP phosphodiesterase [Vibrio sp.]
MNYLAHLHIAEHCDSQLLGNLLGDFVRGNVNGDYAADVAAGIRLHRWVDAYTDSHDIVREAKQYFPEALKRFAPIALDMFWDHCLSRHWHYYHDKPLRQFVKDVENWVRSQQRTVQEYTTLPESFIEVTDKMWAGGWLESYQQFDNIDFALQRIALRRERLAPLSQCVKTLASEYDQLERLFFAFYPQLLNAARGQ